MTTLLFVHGAGGFLEDRSMADALAGASGVDVDMPEFSDEDMSFEAWARPLRARLESLDPSDILVAHSFGASVLLRVLAERQWGFHEPATLLAMPDWGVGGWDVPEYAFDGPEPTTSLALHHCRDDEVVPFEHLASNAALLPSARIVEHPSGGHQFHGANWHTM
ncbi:MAG: alpha/beta hydrolase [Rhodococcus fascians]